MMGDGVDMMAAALRYLARGWAVFPLHWPTSAGCSCGNHECDNIGKHPLGPAAPHGLDDATQEPLAIVSWWRRWPLANIGLPCGGNGLAVLDVDPRNDGTTSLGRLERVVGVLPGTICQVTGSGGCHLVYAHPGHKVKSNSAAFGDDMPGLDVKGDGGYVVVAPSLHASGERYEWIGDDYTSPAAAWPSVLSRLLDPQPAVPAVRPLFSSPAYIGKGYGSAALQGECTQLRGAPKGKRNDTLNEAAFSLGQLVAVGALEETTVVDILTDVAREVGLTATETRLTIVSGLRSGASAPRTAVTR